MTELESLKQQKQAIDTRIKELELRTGEQHAQDLARQIAAQFTLASIQGRVLEFRTSRDFQSDKSRLVLCSRDPNVGVFEVLQTVEHFRVSPTHRYRW